MSRRESSASSKESVEILFIDHYLIGGQVITTRRRRKIKELGRGEFLLTVTSNQRWSSISKQVATHFNYLDASVLDFFLEVEDASNFILVSKTRDIFDNLDRAGSPPVRVRVRRKIDLSHLEKLRELIKEEHDVPYSVLLVENLPPEETRQRLLNAAKDFLLAITRDPKSAAFYIPSRSSDNVGYDDRSRMVLLGNQLLERKFRHSSSVRSVNQLVGLMRYLNDVLRRNIHVTKRDLFYQDVNLFKDQRVSDNLIEDVAAMLRVTRSSLHVIASAKGKVIGRLTFREGRDRINAMEGLGGRAITAMVDQVDDLESDAEFVLVIEKDAVFQRLAEDRFFNYVPCILITASGQPDMATRMFVKRLREELELPILGFMDADPYGLDILRVYSIGSKSLSFETAELAVPDIRWLGLLPSDLDDYDIPKETLISMTDRDRKRALDLLEEDFVKARPEWQKQIKIMLDKDKKAEIQALSSKHLQYITNVYLPEKISNGDWIPH